MNIYTKRFFRCDCGPRGEEFALEHLLSGDFATMTSTAGPWYCDACGDSWNIEFSRGEIIKISKSSEKITRHAVLLRLRYDPTNDGPIHVLVRGNYYSHLDQEGTLEEQVRYRYEEHDCPTNIFSAAEIVFVGKDDDLHGLFEVVAVHKEPWPEDRNELQHQAEELLEGHS
jgi:hypothetical protein